MTTPTLPIIGSFEMVDVTDAKKVSGFESEAELTGSTTCQFKVTMAKKSGIWNYFGVAEKQNATPSEQKQAANRILCLICFEKQIVHVYKTSTSSGNLWRHLYRKHGIGGAAINLRANFEIDGFRNDKRDFINEDSTVCKSELEMHSSTDDEKSLDVAISSHNETESLYKDIGSMLITEVSKRPDLYQWNCKTVGNSKKTKRDELWQEVYESLGRSIDVNRLQKMWKNIRDRYKKLKNLELDGITEASSRYKYFDQLKFLETHTQNRSILPISSNNSRDTEDIDVSFENTEDDTIDFANCLVSQCDETPEKKIRFADTDDEISPKLYATLRTSNFENTVTTYDENVINPTEIETLKNSCSVVDPASPKRDFDSVIADTVYPDEFDLFGKLVAEKLRKLPTSRIDDIEIKILQLIRREEAESIIQ